MLSKRSQTQNGLYYRMPFICNVQHRQIHRDRKQTVVARGWRRGYEMARLSQALRQLTVKHTEGSTGCHQPGDIIRTS